MPNCFQNLLDYQPLAWVVLAAGLAASGGSLAQARSFPTQARYCEIGGHGLPLESTAQINGQTVSLSPALVIRDEGNRIVVNGYLPQKFSGMCLQGVGGALERVWIMTPTQAREAREAKEASGGQGAQRSAP